MGFDLSKYETVAERQARWWAEHESGRILTKIVHADERTVCVRAELYRNASDERPYATGYAEEVRGSSNVNTTSPLENCETSAIGRALAAAGLAGSDPARRPSREEMQKVERNHGSGERPVSVPATNAGHETDPWLDLLNNPDGWFDNREGKKNPKAPDFKAKAGNPNWGKAGEPYQGKPAGLALWLRDAPPNWVEAFDAGDPSLMYPEPKAKRGRTVAAAVKALGGEVVAEGEPPEDGSEPF